MTSPKVSVLMSVLNGEAYLAEAIDSVLAQTFEDFEFVIVDNASTDGTAAIIAAYDDSRIRCLRNDKVLSLTESLNRGLREARGDYVARLDADDVAFPDRFARQAAFLDSDPGVALVGSANTEFSAGGPFSGRLGPVPPAGHDDLMTALAGASILAHSSIMFRRRDALEVGGYPANYTYCMDYLLYFRLARRHRLACLPEPLVAIRTHPAQITALPAWRLRREEEAAAAFQEILGYPELASAPRHNLRRYLAVTCLRLAALLLRQGRLLAAAVWTWRVLAKTPDHFLPACGLALKSIVSHIRPTAAS